PLLLVSFAVICKATNCNAQTKQDILGYRLGISEKELLEKAHSEKYECVKQHKDLGLGDYCSKSALTKSLRPSLEAELHFGFTGSLEVNVAREIRYFFNFKGITRRFIVVNYDTV